MKTWASTDHLNPRRVSVPHIVKQWCLENFVAQEHKPFCLPVPLPRDVILSLQAFTSVPAELCLDSGLQICKFSG